MIRIISVLFGRSVIGRGMVGALAIVTAILVAVTRVGKTSAQRERDRLTIKELVQAVDARRRIDRADIGHGDAVDDREWLRARGSHPPSK
jgi:hypothetical protein